ncbi:MAG: 3-deoxy-8-phosphooctulonate synthase [Bdellovibrionales bacterium]
MTIKHIEIPLPKGGAIKIGNDLPLVFILGPCQMESRDHALETAAAIKEIADKYKVGVIYKSSFDKANRSSIKTQRGIGIDKALPVFAEIRDKMGMPVITDIHERDQCAEVVKVVDVLQIPAFLCRQTDLLVAAGETGRPINVKKGQFLAPWDMKNVAAKIASTGNDKIMLCDRGTSFGYNTLISDMRGLPIMAESGYPVVFDASHSVQQPSGKGESSGGQREFIPVLARAAVAVGAAAIFMEVHEDPDNAPSDGPNMVKLKDLPALIETLVAFDKLAKR